jgi:hypothetical protein
VAKGNDQVFQLSLTEIAFTISFILLLLLGYLVFREQSERLAAESALARIQTTESAIDALNNAKSALASTLRESGTPNPEEVITRLIAADEVRSERDRLKIQVDDLDAKLTALTELQNQLEKVAKSDRPDVTKEEIATALVLQEKLLKAIEQEPNKKTPSSEKSAPTEPSSSVQPSKERRLKEALSHVTQAITATSELKKQLKNQLNKELVPGQEARTVQEVVSAAKSFGEIAKGGVAPETIKQENSDLRGQVAFLKNRLDARGGRDFPPCWADDSGKVEFLYSIETKPDSVAVVPAWPLRREAAALALPGMAGVLSGIHSNRSFVMSIQGVYNWSKQQDPECRHYVQLKSSISDAVQSDRARLMVENYFYKVEARR